MTTKEIQEANQLIDLISYAVKDLNWFSVEHDDLFNFETSKMEELVKMARNNVPNKAIEYFTTNMGEVNEIIIQ